MADDQLSWEQILRGLTAGEKPVDKAADESMLTPKPAAEPLFDEKAFSKRAPSKRKSTKPVAEDSTAYAKKDWGSLKMSVTSQSLTASPGSVRLEEKKLTVKVVAEPKAVAETPASLESDVMSVTELNRNIRGLLEGRFPMIWVKAEISNFKAHTSGHFYFSLKDAKAQISAVMFRGFNSALRFRPEDGMEVLVRGKITVFEPRGNYQIFVEVMEPVGAGALQKAYEQLKAKLQKEGLFDAARKRPLPVLPKHIAIVTSPTGAAIRDMLNVLGRRFKGARITILPCKVQGDQAPREIVAAIALAACLPDVDVMIVGRGGGSIEDLWAFNDEKVARAIAAAPVPVISAVGHEVDFTIADFVADLRAPTPSAAAELVVKSAAELLDRVQALSRGLRYSVLRRLNDSRQSTQSLSKRLVDPQRSLQDAAIRCDDLLHRLHLATQRRLRENRAHVRLQIQALGTPEKRLQRDRQTIRVLEARLKAGARQTMMRKRSTLTQAMAVLDSLSPLRVLDRGFSMVTVGDRIVTSAQDVNVGDKVNVKMGQGSFEAAVTAVNRDPKKGT